MDWDEYFIKIMRVVKSKSKDRSTKVGAVIVNKENIIISTGYNGFPIGANDNIEERHERPTKYLITEHAERNAIYSAAKEGRSLKNSIIYIDYYPCTDCARAIIQSGIKEIVLDGKDWEEKVKYWDERWKENMNFSKEILKECDIKIRISKSYD